MKNSKIIARNNYMFLYFTSFPHKLLLLIEQKNKIICWSSNGDSIEIDYVLLISYLQSDKSIFEIVTLKDFLETMHILGFSKVNSTEISPRSVHKFTSEQFKRGTEIISDVYQHIKKVSIPKNRKRMIASFELLQKLSLVEKRSQMKVSHLELSRIKLKLALEHNFCNINEKENSAIRCHVVEPDYLKTKEIAGYYGNVSLEKLKKGFTNYFPLYQEESFHSQNDLMVVENFQTFDISEIPVLEETELIENKIFDTNVEISEINMPNDSFEAIHPKKKSKPNKLYDEDETAVMFLTQSQTE